MGKATTLDPFQRKQSLKIVRQLKNLSCGMCQELLSFLVTHTMPEFPVGDSGVGSGLYKQAENM